MSTIHITSLIRRHRPPVMHVAFSAALAALVVFGIDGAGVGLAQTGTPPSATTNGSAPADSTPTGSTPSGGGNLLPDRFKAPIGHRQPTAQDIPSDVRVEERSPPSEDKALDQALKGICRGC